DETALVHVIQAPGNAHGDMSRVIDVQAMIAIHQGLSARPVNVFQDEKAALGSGVTPGIEPADDVRVVQPFGDDDFTLEPVQLNRIMGQVFGNYFDRDRPALVRIVAQIYLAHSALAQYAQ